MPLIQTIPTKMLSTTDLPRVNADWSKIARFAATFDPRAEMPNGSNLTGIGDVTRESTLVELRFALYIEWRRYNHFAREPEMEVLRRVQSVIEWIRDRLHNVVA